MATKQELTDAEKKLLECAQKNEEDEVKRLLKDPINVNCLDKHGMSALQHAAYRGNVELCELLLSLGADVNSNEQEYGYTALMFAALSGNVPCTKLMLENGAKVYHTNSVGRTAAQMAGFVSQHQVVALINNFFSLEDLEYYAKPQGLEKVAKLPAHLVSPLHRMILMTNLHPVKLSLYLKEHKELLVDSKKVIKVLQAISEKQMKNKETDEILALKMHYLSHVVKNCATQVDDVKKYDNWIKSLVKENDNMFPETQEKLVRSTFTDFPYASCALLCQVLRTVSAVKLGDHPTALTTLTQAINGQHLQDEIGECETCGESKAALKCSACKAVSYCNKNCQKLHWFSHKKFCKELGVKMKKQQEEQARIDAEDAAKKKLKEEEEAAKKKLEETSVGGDSVQENSTVEDTATGSETATAVEP